MPTIVSFHVFIHCWIALSGMWKTTILYKLFRNEKKELAVCVSRQPLYDLFCRWCTCLVWMHSTKLLCHGIAIAIQIKYFVQQNSPNLWSTLLICDLSIFWFIRKGASVRKTNSESFKQTTNRNNEEIQKKFGYENETDALFTTNTYKKIKIIISIPKLT